jgi:Transport protein Avl9
LVQNFKDGVDEGELYMGPFPWEKADVGMSAREILYKFKWRTLILFKALLLEKRVSLK